MTDQQDDTNLTWRRYQDGDSAPVPLEEKIFNAGHTHQCPTYVHRTPPCQGSCPSGHDIRGWLAIARGMDKPPVEGMPWQEYAFERMIAANPFPSIMGRVCPAPCEDGCNRNEVEDFVGINADGLMLGNLLASFSHQRHTAQNPWAMRFLAFVRECRRRKAVSDQPSAKKCFLADR